MTSYEKKALVLFALMILVALLTFAVLSADTEAQVPVATERPTLTPPPHDWKASPTPPAPENSYLVPQFYAYP